MNTQSPEEKSKQRIRQLIWLYFVLLLIEGALRKWVVPQLSNPLLIVRDPVALAIYVYAIQGKLFPRNAYVVSLLIIGGLSLLASILVLYPYLPLQPILGVTLYGFRANFFHLPLIFVMAKVMDAEDVKRIGWWILLIMIPMSLIMVAQFEASPEAFINRAAGLGEAQQLTAGGGKIRPPGTFSFISGPIFYVSVTAAFLIYGALTKNAYKLWLLIASGAALVLAIGVSGSRSCVASTLLVVLTLVVIVVIRPKAVNQFGWAVLIVVIGALIITRLPIFKEGLSVLSDRFTESAEAADTTILGGMIDRMIGGFTEGFKNLDKAPLWGWGLGIGTAGGARFLIGQATFLLAENEWTRVLFESGPILGLAFLLWRTALTLRLLWVSLAALSRGAILPLLLFSSGFIALLNGQLGQPTSLGFAVFLCGLCLASTQLKEPGAVPAVPDAKDIVPRRLPRRSEHAIRLHDPRVAAKHTNGFADR